MFLEAMAGVSVLSGLYGLSQQDAAQKAGIDLQNKSLALQEQGLQLSREQMQADAYRYQEFKNLYGDIEKNLSNYYTNLSPDVYSTQMNDAITKQFNVASEQLRQNMALRGIEGSGVEASNMANLYSNKALAEADAVANAPQWVAQQQQSFYTGQAAPQQNTLIGAMQNSTNAAIGQYGNVGSQMNMMSGTQMNLASQYGQGAASAIGGGMYTLGRLFGED